MEMQEKDDLKDIEELSNKTRIDILKHCRENLMTITELQKKLNIAYKNVFLQVKYLEKMGSVVRISLDEQNNLTYVIPLYFTEEFTDFNEFETNFQRIASFSKTLILEFIPGENNEHESEAHRVTLQVKKILLFIKNNYPKLKFEINYKFSSRKARFRIKGKLELKLVEPLIRTSLKIMSKEERSKLKFDIENYIKLLNKS
jgi:predicted transcriptional regulator